MSPLITDLRDFDLENTYEIEIIIRMHPAEVTWYEKICRTLDTAKKEVAKVANVAANGIKDSSIWAVSVNGSYAVLGAAVGFGDMALEFSEVDFQVKKNALLQSGFTQVLVSAAGENVGLLAGSVANGVFSGLAIAAPIGVAGGIYFGSRKFSCSAKGGSVFKICGGALGGVLGGVIGGIVGRVLTKQTVPQLILVSASLGAFLSIFEVAKRNFPALPMPRFHIKAS